ncbi:lysozyme [Sphingomonas oryzagri]|uniref:Lysozyme n=1 Tax=Sphingomonas oryzagri TaxID=3042314 RepID=A0ABT6N605_9SPHN|nr:lysozyme [Sphingomonas oryzagri]MDH7640530.1 lysozyme [Sphingomonas oryzagri]
MTDDRAALSRVNRWPKLAAAIGATAAIITGTTVTKWESGGQQHLEAYHGAADAPGIWTICDGDTLNVKPGDRETSAGCAVRVDKRLVSFVAPVLKAAPTLKGHPYQLAASISLAYNIGAANFATSTVARRFRAGDWVGACTAFAMWNRANGKVVPGLVNRRTDEIKICLTELPK